MLSSLEISLQLFTKVNPTVSVLADLFSGLLVAVVTFLFRASTLKSSTLLDTEASVADDLVLPAVLNLDVSAVE